MMRLHLFFMTLILVASLWGPQVGSIRNQNRGLTDRFENDHRDLGNCTSRQEKWVNRMYQANQNYQEPIIRSSSNDGEVWVFYNEVTNTRT